MTQVYNSHECPCEPCYEFYNGNKVQSWGDIADGPNCQGIADSEDLTDVSLSPGDITLIAESLEFAKAMEMDDRTVKGQNRRSHFASLIEHIQDHF